MRFGHTYGSILMKSHDRGEHWDSIPSPTSSYLYSVAFADAHTGWVGADSGKIFRQRTAGPPGRTSHHGVGTDQSDPDSGRTTRLGGY